MKDVRNDAARLALLHDLGAISYVEIVRWADRLIVREEEPSQSLIELSTASVNDVRSALGKLARDADVWPPVEAALPQILEFVVQKPDEAPFVARTLYGIAVAQEYKVPDALKFILMADDDFDLAASGCYFLEDVYRRFIEDIKVAMGSRPSN